MTIKTKKYKLPRSKYVLLAFGSLLKRQWWVLVLFAIATGAVAYWASYLWGLLPLGLMVIYLLFWLVQFYGVTLLEENSVLFSPVQYQITSRQILMQFTTKQGMPIEWSKVKSVRVGKKAIVLFLSKAHFIYLPQRIFRTAQEKEFLIFLLKNKKLL